MRITKTMAHTAAMLMACKKYDPVVKQAKDNLGGYVTRVVQNLLPQEVFMVCQKYPKIFYVSNDVYYRWNTKSYHVTLPFNIPAILSPLSNEFYPTNIQLRIKDACQAVYRAECERENLEERIQLTLINLRTRKRIESDFPEASEYIEWPVDKQVPAVPVPNDIRKLFQK